ncbi:MAG: hypothetical protein N3E44_00935 [Candidatus Bathyarchaeota archaeon]|nr:hypothetical protein [Candidatus Bathyarchaeota archaeon]
MNTRSLALTIYTSAVYVVLSYLPGFPVVGAENVKIGFISGVAPIFGLLLGPWLGFLSCFIGACINRILLGANLFQWLTLPTTPISAFIAGALVRAYLKNIRGWHISALILTILISIWYLTPIGRAIPYFPVLHWIALILTISFRDRLTMIYNDLDKVRLALYVAIVSFSATMTAHMYGTLMFVLSTYLLILEVQDLTLLLASLIPLVAIERLTFTAIATILGVPLILVFRKNKYIGIDNL